MDAQRWSVIDSLYHAALEKEPGERSAYLAEACAKDPALRNEIESLLGYADVKLSSPVQPLRMPELLDKVAGITFSNAEGTSGWPATGFAALPAAIGRYRVLSLVGAGGMGVVYEAEQEQPRRAVALKVIKPGMAGAELLRRFEQESQTLGRLQHPGIAQIYEAGTADTGFGPQPYFAMEFIRGESLLEYAEAHQLNTRQRLELMAKVCEAVHHAHQRGIIHRDLKPGNILVDESGQPKVLDFGVARVTDSDARATRHTDVGRLVGTLAYMSPEQVLADPLELDTRSDVYALGVVLCELLTARLPYKISGNLPEAVRTIREEDPAPLSSINRTYRGDIETIVAKALEKDKARRYASAAGMAGDIRRYLTDQPIAARPPSATYQLQKFARRHKAVVVGVAAVFVVLVAGIIVSTWEAARARRAEQTASKEAATAKAVNDFLQNDLLAQASPRNQARPDTKPNPDLKVRIALDRAATRIAGKFDKEPFVEASIRRTLGNTYGDLGLYPEAQQQLERALQLRYRVLGQDNPDTVGTMHDLASLYWRQGKYSQAEPMFLKALSVQRRILGTEHYEVLSTMTDLAVLYMSEGKHTQAESLLTRALEMSRQVLGTKSRETLDLMTNLANLDMESGKYAHAELLFTEVLETSRRVLGDEHPDTLAAMNFLAMVYDYERKYPQAESFYLESLAGRRRVLGEAHPDTLGSMNNLAHLYRDEGKYALAEPLSIKVLDGTRRVLGQEHPYTLIAMGSLAVIYREQGKYAQAEPLVTRVAEIRHRVLGEDHPDTLRGINNLALLYQEQRKYTRAEPLFRKVLEVRRRVLGEAHPDTLTTANELARLHLIQRKYTQAEALLREALNSHQKTNSDSWTRYICQSMLGASLAGEKKYADAESLLLSGYEGMLQRKSTIPAGDLSSLKQARKWLVELYRDWGKPEKAVELHQRFPE